MYDHCRQIALRIYCDGPLAPLDFLAGAITAPPPFCAVLADCESTIATLGEAFRPCAFGLVRAGALPGRSESFLQLAQNGENLGVEPLLQDLRQLPCFRLQGPNQSNRQIRKEISEFNVSTTQRIARQDDTLDR